MSKKRNSKLERWEISLVKAMLSTGSYNDQEILAYFTRPTRSINHRVISEIRNDAKHKSIKPADESTLKNFLSAWPNIDVQTGLNFRGDELLIKAREAMIAAVHTFNGVGINFRAELFIVTSIIAWTYLFHAWLKREGVDYRYKNKDGSICKTKAGADKYWELSTCIEKANCNLSDGVKNNLSFLIELRHEIEHRSTSRIDSKISSQLQACCINFNTFLKSAFGGQYGLEKRLPIALQFVTFDVEQKLLLKAASDLPHNITTMLDTFHAKLTEDQAGDLEFAYRAMFIPKTSNRIGKADVAIEVISADSEEAIAANKIFLKETDKKRFTPSKIVEIMQGEGFDKFSLHYHTKLWQKLDAKNPKKKFGREGDYKGSWVWYENWLDRVRTHCQEKSDIYSS